MAKEEEKKKAPAKKAETKAAPKKAASSAKKEAPAAKKKAPAKKTAKKAPSGKTITVTQIGSPISRESSQRKTLIGLGLNKMHRTSTLEDTPSVRGMIRKVHHLVKVEEAA